MDPQTYRAQIQRRLAEEDQRLSDAALLDWMAENFPVRHTTLVMGPDYFVADVDAWTAFMADPAGREEFPTLRVVPIELDRVPDPIDPSRAIVHWLVIEQFKPSREEAA